MGSLGSGVQFSLRPLSPTGPAGLLASPSYLLWRSAFPLPSGFHQGSLSPRRGGEGDCHPPEQIQRITPPPGSPPSSFPTHTLLHPLLPLSTAPSAILRPRVPWSRAGPASPGLRPLVTAQEQAANTPVSCIEQLTWNLSSHPHSNPV